jgi:aryl-alcohol dehydrogenase-like predicted oxidoreductase
MERRTLGRTGLSATVLGYGAMAIRQQPISSSSDASENPGGVLLNQLLDAGINFIDTAPDYGHSEEIIGQSIAHRRDEYLLASKCGCNIPRDDNPDAPRHIWTAERLRANIELSLKRMKTDYLDFWQLHNPDPDAVREGELLGVMEQMRDAGKVRHIGISSTLPHIPVYLAWGVFASFQIPYSALERQHERAITAAAGCGAATIIRGGVAKGEPGTDRSTSDRWKFWDAAGLDELRDPDESRSAFLLRFTITHPHVHTTIVGTSNPEHLAENLKAAAKGPLPADVYEQARRRLDAAGQTPEPTT